jgi:hypothetical protein
VGGGGGVVVGVVVGGVVVGVVVGGVRGTVVVGEAFGAADLGGVPIPEAVRMTATMAATTAAPMAPTMTRFLFMAHSSWTLCWTCALAMTSTTGGWRRRLPAQEILKEATDSLSNGRKWVQSAFAPAATKTLLTCWPTTKHAISL